MGRIAGPAAPALLEWLEHFWPDHLPPESRNGYAQSVKVESGVRGGFPFVVEKTVPSYGPYPADVPPIGRVLVAAFVARPAGVPPSELVEWRPLSMLSMALASLR